MVPSGHKYKGVNFAPFTLSLFCLCKKCISVVAAEFQPFDVVKMMRREKKMPLAFVSIYSEEKESMILQHAIALLHFSIIVTVSKAFSYYWWNTAQLIRRT